VLRQATNETQATWVTQVTQVTPRVLLSVPYRVDLRATGDDVFDRLIELGAIDVESAPDGMAALMPDSVPVERLVNVPGIAGVSVSPAIGRDADSIWILAPRPIQVGRLRMVPASCDTGPDAIRLMDSAAFGTGLHPTTVLCLEALQEIVGNGVPDAVLDVGTGSGVLALAALRLGVPRARGIDIEDAALVAAGENARLNGVADRLVLTSGGPETVTGAWPLVLANVLAAPLLEMAPAIVRRVGHHGLLVLSGIPSAVEPDVDQAYRRLGLQPVRSATRGGWVALVLQASW
jgi:ribosomal protein L11 methyltransferase